MSERKTVTGRLVNHTVASNVLFYIYPVPPAPPYYIKVTTDSSGYFAAELAAGTYTPIKVYRYDPPGYVPCCGPSSITVPGGAGAFDIGNIDGCGYYKRFEEPFDEEEIDLPAEG